jgi:adenylate cyclase
MNKTWEIVVPGLLLIGAVALRWIDPSPVQDLRNLVFDNFQRISPRAYNPDLPVRIADIDEKSLDKFGQWPWSRAVLAKVVDRLHQLGAAVVAFDVLLAEPDRTGPKAVIDNLPDDPKFLGVKAQMETLPDPDQQLAEAVTKVPTVFGFAMLGYDPKRPQAKPRPVGGFSSNGDSPLYFVPQYNYVIGALPSLQAAAAGNGAVNSDPDDDGVVRRIPLILNFRGKIGGEGLATDHFLPTLGMEAIRLAFRSPSYTVRASGSNREALAGLFASGIGAIRIEGSPIIIKTNRSGEILLHDTGHEPERFISISDLFDPDFDRSRVEGRIILIGTSVEGLKDVQTSPLAANVPGVEIQAQTIEQILETALGGVLPLQRPYWSDAAEIAYLLLFGLLVIAFSRRSNALTALCVVIAAFAIAIGGSWFAFRRYGFLVDPLYPSGVAVILLISSTLLGFLRTEGEKRFLRSAMSRYLSPALVNRLTPGNMKLGGEIRELTLMFTDIRGFTKMSEGLNPEELTRVINSFLTPMTDVILRNAGAVDKYIGDCIMAFWNAPLDIPAHGKQAIRAALQMREELNALNARFKSEAKLTGLKKVKIKAGIGLNSGLCCVGNMGSDQKFNYSALGDTVNIASRLEALSPAYRLDLVIGEETAAAAPDFALLEIDQVQVKGKAIPIRIYTGVGDERMAATAEFRRLKDIHDRMLAAYRGQDWAAAADAAEQCRSTAPESLTGFYEIYAARIAEFRADPPPADWDGVYVAKSKTG